MDSQTSTGATTSVSFPIALLSPSPSTSSSTDSMTTYTPSACLFCPHAAQDINSNLQHMSKFHNFFIPNLEQLVDVASFLTFLNTIISEFHECLFCGTARSNKWATQDHMKSKGHCRIDLEDEYEEWGGFWDYPSSSDDEDLAEDEDDIVSKKVEDNQIHLKSGRNLAHSPQVRHDRRKTRNPLSLPSPCGRLHANRIINPENLTQLSTSTPLAIRAGTSTSLIGVPELQLRALRATEKKMVQMETRAKERYRSGLDSRGNVKKFFVVLRRRERVFGSV